MAVLDPWAVAALNTAQLAALSSTQISAFDLSTSQLMTLTSSALSGLTQSQIKSIGNLRFLTPVVLDLDGNGIQTVSVREGVSFDIDNDGALERTGWVGHGDGLLVRDLNGDGVINNGGELFGEGTILSTGQKARDGYEAMRALDGNLDGILDANDAAFSQLAVWADKNGNGLTETGEVISLGELGITSLSLSATRSSEINNGNLIGLMGSYTTANGGMHTMGDVWFQTDANGRRVFDLAALAKAAGGPNISLVDASADTLKVSLSDVLAVGEIDILSGTSSVTITGDAGDIVQLEGGGDWSLAGTATDGAENYMVYVNQTAQLWVNEKIQTVIV